MATLSPKDKSLLIDILNSIGINNDFTYTGTIEKDDDLQFGVWLEKEIKLIGTFGKLDMEILQTLTKKSHYGNVKTWTDEIDDNVRISTELELDNVYKIIKSKNLIESVNFDFEPKILSKHIRIEPYKLIIYEKGNFFKKHKDSMSTDKMIGTIILSLTSDYTGGTLVVEHCSQRKEFKLNEREWVFLYGDCDHEILPVESGHRITMTFRVYSENSSEMLSVINKTTEEKCKLFVDEVYKLAEKMEEVQFFIPFFHEYPDSIVNSYKRAERSKYLKSSDKYLCELFLMNRPGFDGCIDILKYNYWTDAKTNELVDEGYDYGQEEYGEILWPDFRELTWKEKFHEDHIFGNGCGYDKIEYSKILLNIHIYVSN